MNNAFLRSRHAIAVAQMIGLHRDPKVYNAKPLEAERARRLWWKVYNMDRALSLFMGRPYTINDKFVDVEMCLPYDDNLLSEGPDGELVIDKPKTDKSVMYYRLYKYISQLANLTVVIEYRGISFLISLTTTSPFNLLISQKLWSLKQGISPP